MFEREVNRRIDEWADQRVNRSKLKKLKHQIKKLKREVRSTKTMVRRGKNHTWKKITGVGKSIGQLISKTKLQKQGQNGTRPQ